MAKNLNIGTTMEAWAEIVIEIWEQQVEKMDIKDTGALLDSFYHSVHTNSGGNPERIEFAFNYYGKMVDMGVGGNVSLQNRDAMKALGKSTRKPKPWYSDTFGYQLHKLGEILSEKYAKKAALNVVETFQQKRL